MIIRLRATAFTLLILLTGADVQAVYAQYFQFSQPRFSEQRINPAYVAMSDFASASFLYRQQRAAEDFSINSSFASLVLPFLTREEGYRWTGIGVTFLDDRSGLNGIFQVQEMGLSYAIRVRIDPSQSLYFGVRGLYETRSFSLDGLYTGTQYIPGRGFNTSISSGETPDDFRQQFFTFSTGLTWELTQRNGLPLAQAGIALFDINKVDQAFFYGESVSPVTAVLEGKLHLSGPTRLSLDPVALLTFGQTTEINLGGIWGYRLNDGDLALVTRYVIGRYAIAGLQYIRDNIEIGISYDVALSQQAGNRGSFEVGIKLKHLIKPRPRTEKEETGEMDRTETRAMISRLSRRMMELSYKDSLPAANIKRVQLIKSSEAGKARAGDLIYYPYVNENSTLRFHFDFNSTELSAQSIAYLEDIVDLLMDNPALRISIVGHTDNLGTPSYNLTLSKNRAARIQRFLTENGIDESRITVDGKGESMPVAPNSTEKGRETNRRVEFTIIR